MRSVIGFVVLASLVQSVGFASLLVSVLQFGLLVGFLVAVGAVGLWRIGAFSSVSGDLDLVDGVAVAAVPVSCARGCAACPAGCGLVSSVAVLPAGCALLLSRSGKRLGGAALAGRVRSLVQSGELVLV
jgi:hypothetical protein